MAAPAYTEDLTDIDLAESGSTGWTAFNISGGGGGAPAFGADFGMQGGGCWDKAASNAERGAAVNKTPGAGTVAAGVHIFQWGFVATPGVTDTLQNRGAYVIIGTSTSNFMQFHVEGSDTYGAQGRVGKCYVVDYVTTPTSPVGSGPPYRTVNGTPGATPTYFGFGIKTLATVKGSNFGVDAVRYGTGAYLTAGELISAGDASDNPCTFRGFATQNDNNTNRWGILTSIGGASYELQGRFVIGQNNAGTATLCRFKGGDINILLVDTVHSTTDFTQFIIDHASTRCEWTNVNITGLGTNNPGRIVVNSANPTFIVVGGTWTDIGITTLRSNSTLTGVTWRGADQITQNGATIDGCLIDSTIASAAILSDNPTEIQDCTFISDGSSHAVQLDSVGVSPAVYSWTGNIDSGYTGTRGTNLTPNSGSTNAAFYNNTGQHVTLNVAGGGLAPSVRNGAGASTTVNNNVSVTLTNIQPGTEIRVYPTESPISTTQIAGIENTGSPTEFTFSASGGLVVDIVVLNIDYVLPPDNRISGFTIPATDTSFPISQIIDRNYFNP